MKKLMILLLSAAAAFAQIETGQINLEGVEHIVVDRDWLTKLAIHYYDDMSQWKLIYENNKHVKNPDLIYPGMRLLIPGRMGRIGEPAEPDVTKIAEPEQVNGVEHIVVDRDWLSKLAIHYYDDMSKWKLIHEHNKHVKNPDLIYPGMRLLIPGIMEEPEVIEIAEPEPEPEEEPIPVEEPVVEVVEEEPVIEIVEEEPEPDRPMYVFSVRPELASGFKALGIGATAEFGVITKKDLYITGQLSGGVRYFGIEANVGKYLNKEWELGGMKVKNVFGGSVGYRNILHPVHFVVRQTGETVETENGSNVGIAGGFWKIMLGGRHNLDVTNKILLGYKTNPSDYDGKNVSYDTGFDMMYVLGIGYTLTKVKK